MLFIIGLSIGIILGLILGPSKERIEIAYTEGYLSALRTMKGKNNDS